MVLGIATAGAVLYAFVPPPILQKVPLELSEVLSFLSGLRYAYIAGGVATLSAAVIACLSSDVNHHI
jgi:hypothetical protein